ncbi:hypothetical protein RUM44_008502 [Polyplax serrata]|uniref:TOG domain-containing protein n=1 Tax=Polyplax serrata TaxID=468196 RepID=A0ABR1BCG7_POLSC
MAETELGKALKDWAVRIQTSSRNERKQTIESVISVLSHPNVTESIVRGISKVILLTLPRYRDGASRYYVRNLVRELCIRHKDWTFNHLVLSIFDYATTHKLLVASKNTAQTALCALSWTSILVQNTLKEGPVDSKEEFHKLIEAQAMLTLSVCASENKKLMEATNHSLCSMWSSVEPIWVAYTDGLLKLDATPHSLVFGSHFVKFLKSKNQNDLISKCKPGIIDALVKVVLQSKKKPEPYILRASVGLLQLITHEEFSTTILPSLQKAMLRSPENILESVGLILSGLSLDLSKYAMDVGKLLIANLHSKDDLSRDEAAESLKHLSKHCSDAETVQGLLNHLFAVFQGSEGKITVSTHKMSLLQGAGNLAENCLTGNSSQTVATCATEHILKVLETEVHEKTLVLALEMLSKWGAKFTEIPKKLLDWFDKGMNLKTSTPAVRTAYIDCMSSCFHGANLNQGSAVVTTLVNALATGGAGPKTAQLESLSAACLLMRLASSDICSEKQTNTLWNLVLDMDKQYFVSEKFLASATDKGLTNVMRLSEHILLDHSDRINGKGQPIYRAILYCLTAPNNSVRNFSRTVVKRLVSVLGGTKLALSLVKEFSWFVDEVASGSLLKVEGSTKDGTSPGEREILPNALMDALLAICSGKNLADDAHQLALATIICAHHPIFKKCTKNLWHKLLKQLNIDWNRFMTLHKSALIKVLVEDFEPTESVESALKTVIEMEPEIFVPLIVNHVTSTLKELSGVKVTRDEYFTFLTPEGELYDKSILSGQNQESSVVANMKRESKVYSFKEQLEELQLRRELEEKKRKSGKVKEPELTPKQKEMIRVQLEKESAIRTKLQGLKSKISVCVSMLKAASEGNHEKLSTFFKDVLPVVLGNLNSPLSAPYMSKLYLDLGECVFIGRQKLFGNLVGNVTLRVLKPQCDLNPAWEQEPLSEASVRTVNEIPQLYVSPKTLSGPSFCYCFALLKNSLLEHSGKEDDSFISTGLQIISDHAKMRGKSEEDLWHPKLLVRQQMLVLLTDLISMNGGRLQQMASNCLLEVASAASGNDDGCCRAEYGEIEALLTAVQNPSEIVREAGLKGLTAMHRSFPGIKENFELNTLITRRIWVASYDVNEDNCGFANNLWELAKLETNPEILCDELLKDIVHPVQAIRQAGAKALASLIKLNYQPILVRNALDELKKIFMEKLVMIPPQVNHLGRITEHPIDTWEPRSGVALALEELAMLLELDMVPELVSFFVSVGLGDRNSEVRKNLLSAALAIVNFHGRETINSVLPIFEEFLDKAPNSSSYDAVRQSVIILMGSLARHLDKDDAKIKPIVDRLIDALSTPSQQVQEAVANCLPPLVPAIKDDAPELASKLLQQLLGSGNYGQRKGAAYGLAGLVKGMGILALKQLDIMTTLTAAIQNKNDYKRREGALFAFEMLCNMLGRLFEPYIVHVLPHLLLCFGDNSQFVRTATDATARVVMSKLSAHGVKLVLPSLLAALEEDSWRTKTGSVELLGAMAYCAPKQLSSCLPSIVPKLIEVLSDSHMKVQKAGAQALKVIGSVIRNPEIQAIVPVLLEALQDPSAKTATSLQTLLDTKFVHFIDAPSLALIMPVVQRAFTDRSTETRKMAAQIIGNMYSLTDQKDLSPYLPAIIPGLKTSLLDPVPEVRSVSARALGAMVRGMGEASFEDLLPWLMQTLTSESSSVDRSGAAQGLSEVVGGLGVEKLHKLMPDIIATAERTDIAPHVKDGYIMMFIYMPVVFTTEFTPYIGQIINPILKALADENEYVRDTALKAGQRIVTLYADTAIMLLLPELESGLFDDNWRIRYSSVQLLGDLLYLISGVSGKMSTETADEDDNFGTEQSHKAIIDALGAERRNRVLAGLYMGRSDVALMVRQAALHVWKVVVTNTPRTLREILPTLFGLLLGCLASTSLDKRQVAARTLGDLVRKLGERVLPDIIPILEKGLESEQADQRQGVCIGLSEIMASTSRDMVLTFVNSLVPTVRKALCDPLPEVRQAAAKTFDSLHSTVGVRALDDILPTMLQQLNSPDILLAESTLDGLRQVMAIKSRVVLPYLVPQLTAAPVNTKALSILASVAGDALTKYLRKILPALLSALSSAQGTPQQAQELEYCQAVVLSVTDEAGIRTIMDQLMETTRSEKVELRCSAATLLCAFCGSTTADYSRYVPQLFRGLIHLFTDSDRDVLQMSWEALSAVTRTLDANQQMAHVADVRQAVRFAVSDLKGQDLLPGFCLPKGITPILPIFREAILNGLPEIKEQAAQGLGEVIKLTSAQALQPSVVHITGPLIRILGDRFNWNVKAAVLETLALLLSKVGLMLKQFLPQLQTTFLKALNDSNRQVRLKAAYALGHLIVIHTKADPLFSELHSGVKSSDDSSIRETLLQALRGVITPAGDKMTLPLRKQVYSTLLNLLSHPEDVTRSAAAGCLGALCKYLPPEMLATTLTDHLLQEDTSADWTLRHGRSAALYVALKEAPEVIYTDSNKDKLCKVLLLHLSADRVPIAMNGVRSCGYLLQYLMTNEKPLPTPILGPFVRTMNHSSNEVKQLVARVCSFLARMVPSNLMVPEFLKIVIPMLVNGTKEKNGYVKANSELALVAVLGLRNGEEGLQECMALLDVGARESLSDVVSKVLKKVAVLPEGKEEDLDDTLLT